jgi:hypothetical protein
VRNRMPEDIEARMRSNGHVPETMSAAELMSKELPPAKWAVSDVLPEGVTILGGKPKMGKSWLALGLCVSVAAGGYAFGKIAAERGGALYLGLEDQERRLQRRLKKVLAGEDAPDGLEVAWSWPRLDQGGVESLRKYIEDRPQTRLVVVDTLKKIRPRESGSRGIYDLDYEALEPLLPLAGQYGIAILVVHHLRKLEAGDPFDMISGSTGLTGGVDGALVLKRDRGKQDATLAIDGRDIEEPTELALRWDADIASWSLMGDAEEYRLVGERREIIEVLREAHPEPLGAKEVAVILGKEDGKGYNATRQRMYQMSKAGEIKLVAHGKYTLPNKPNNTNYDNNPNNPNNGAESVRDVRTVSGVSRDANTSDTAYIKEGRKGRKGREGRNGVEDRDLQRDVPLSADEGNERVQRLIDQGMSEKWAVAEVLGREAEEEPAKAAGIKRAGNMEYVVEWSDGTASTTNRQSLLSDHDYEKCKHCRGYGVEREE